MNVHQIVESVLFASDAPLTADEIARADEMLDEDQVEDALQLLAAEYDDAGRAFQVVEVAEGYQLLTRPEFAPYLERFDNVPRPSRLSGPALETLAIIAYRQPLARLEIEYIRGVSAAGVIRTLQDRRLIDVVGRAEGLGRPLLYGTTLHFLEHFGFRSLEDLPRPDELPVVLRERIPLGDPDEQGDTEEGEGGDQGELDVAEAGSSNGSAPDEDGGAEADEVEPGSGDAEDAEVAAEGVGTEGEPSEVGEGDAGIEVEATGDPAGLDAEAADELDAALDSDPATEFDPTPAGEGFDPEHADSEPLAAIEPNQATESDVAAEAAEAPEPDPATEAAEATEPDASAGAAEATPHDPATEAAEATELDTATAAAETAESDASAETERSDPEPEPVRADGG